MGTSQKPDGSYCFSYKSHVNKKHPDWSVPLTNFPTTWHESCADGVLLPGHTTSSFPRDHTARFVTTTLLWDSLAPSSQPSMQLTRTGTLGSLSSGGRKTAFGPRILMTSLASRNIKHCVKKGPLELFSGCAY